RACTAGCGREAIPDGSRPGLAALTKVLGARPQARREGRRRRGAVPAWLVLAYRGRCTSIARDIEVHGRRPDDPETARLVTGPRWLRPRGAFGARCLRQERPQARSGAVRSAGREGPARRAGVGDAALARAFLSHYISYERYKMIVGFIGLGTMGAPMARNILAKGHRLIVADVQPAAVAALIAAGATAAATPRDVAAASGIVITMLPDAPDVERVALGPDGIVAGIN